MPPLRGAVIGFGAVGAGGHWPALAASSALEIVAAVDPSAARRAAAAALAPGIRLYASVEELARAEVLDFVDVATPPSSHAPIAEFALGHGWHVLCEKPLTLDPRAFERLAAAARDADRVLFTVHNWKWAPIFQGAFAVVREGRLGKVRHVSLLVSRNQACKGAADGATSPAGAPPEDWRQDRGIAGGGILVDHGWHNFYLMLDLVGESPERVAATITRPFDRADALEDRAEVSVAFAAARGRVELTWHAPYRRNVVTVHGDEGWMVVDDDRLVVGTRGAPVEERAFGAPLSAGSHHADWFRGVVRQFLDEVGDPSCRGHNLREAAWCVSLIDAAYRSAGDGGREQEVGRIVPSGGRSLTIL